MSSMLVPLLTFVLSALLCAPAHADDARLADTYRFLVTYREPDRGALGTVQEGELKGAAYPYSFYSTAEYWGAYVCALPEAQCAVTDVYDPGDYTLVPPTGLPGDLQVERVNTHAGSNIYDAATWQIAVMLGRVKLGLEANVKSAYALVSTQNELLALPVRRALTSGDTFRYNGKPIKAPAHAYAFRMQADRYIVTDPFTGTRYASLVRAQGIPRGNRNYAPGRITWTDWKPFTGENAWAFLLGPLHAAYIHYVIELKREAVPWNDAAVTNALAVLPTFAQMQAEIGGVYYAPSGVFANQGKQLVSPYFVSVENNASLYAGLVVLRGTLEAQLAHSALTSEQRQQAREALALIRVMIHGGKLPGGRTTAGLLSFFRHAAWHEKQFVQGGYANDPSRAQAWEPVLAPKAVDANTWTIAALGPERIDAWFGAGAARAVWERVKQWGGYGEGTTLLGVGYSDQDGNGRNDKGVYGDGVLSSEWTAGAIATVRRLIEHYGNERSLVRDESTMLEGMQRLRYDVYVRTPFRGKPEGFTRWVPQNSLPYLYASRRAFVPFGWYANPLPSTCATAWAILLAARYDVFRYGGGDRNTAAKAHP
jgi:hypothetical protein